MKYFTNFKSACDVDSNCRNSTYALCILGTCSNEVGNVTINAVTPFNPRAGTVVTIIGVYFGSYSSRVSLKLGGKDITKYVLSWNDTSILFQLPANSRSGYLVVTVIVRASNSFYLGVSVPVVSGNLKLSPFLI